MDGVKCTNLIKMQDISRSNAIEKAFFGRGRAESGRKADLDYSPKSRHMFLYSRHERRPLQLRCKELSVLFWSEVRESICRPFLIKELDVTRDLCLDIFASGYMEIVK